MTTESQSYKSNERDEISLQELILKIRQWFKYLLSKWILILLFGILGGGLGFWYATVKKPVYTATATFVLEDGEKGIGLGNLGGLASMAGIDLGGGGGLFQGDNIIELYKSRLMIQKVLLSSYTVNQKQVKLIDWFIEFNELKKTWAKTDWRKINFTDTTKMSILQDSVLREVVKEINKNYLSVKRPDKKLSKIQVDFKAKDELFAKAFTEYIVDAVNNFYITTKTQRSSKNVAILQRKTDSVRAVMNGAIYTVVAVADATPNLNPTRQVQRAVPVQRAQFSAETNKAVLSEMVKNLELARFTLLKETPLIQMVDRPILPLEKDKLSKLKGIFFGGLLFGFLIVAYLILKKLFANL
ncbi:MAG: lipopolysaccharide biosynthesis protein [Pedobacter sp.]|nr:MAG: lipopolysaccharide biosynthesis protein [Pedobacter sp.]